MPRSKVRRWWPWLAGSLLAGGLLIAAQFVCLSAWLRWGIVVPECPDGTPRQVVRLDGASLMRGAKGTVVCRANALYTTGPADWARTVALEPRSCSLTLVGGGKESPLEPVKGWRAESGMRVAQVELPKLPDGDYQLRARVTTSLGEASVDAPLPLYAPARVHVITDRPLYEPGNTVRFRAVALRARDLAPLDGRPGRWVVTDPTGETMLEERAPAGEWGVVAGSFPLDAGAQSGTWKVSWVSGDSSDQVSFRVEPFTLPRFRIEAAADRPFYGRGGRPKVRGSVVYSSGAPVAGAQVTLQWSNSGEWPPPSEWLEGGLPTLAKCDEAGRFAFELPAVPGDLRGRASLFAQLSAVDAAGDRVEGSLSLLLSEEPIQVAAVTELGDRIAAGSNNRVWLRVTDAAGQVQPGAALRIRRAWEPGDEGIEAVADEDGVASLQLDPGPPVNVVIPPMPVRPPKPVPAVERTGALDLLTDRQASLEEMRAMDGWNARLAPCARWLHDQSRSLTLGLRVTASGEITALGGAADPLSSCAAQAIRGARLPAGGERLIRMDYELRDPGLPSLTLSPYGAPDTPDGLTEQLGLFALAARDCLPRTLSENLQLPRVLTWRTRTGSKQVELGWIRDPQAETALLDAGAAACVERNVGAVALAQEQASDLVGFVRFTTNPAAAEEGSRRPQPTVMLGYELKVEAAQGGASMGEARLRLRPGQIPPVRLRATPVVAEPGGKVTVEILRGPGFRGKLPEKLFLQAEAKRLEAKVDEKKRSATFELPAEVQGWLQVEWSGARAVSYVPPRGQLGVALRPERDSYAPGQTATLMLQTSIDGKGAAAAVGLFGVDESLSQLAPLAGPDDLARVRTKVGMTESAFGVLDAQALAMGRVRGARAAEAVVLKVNALPTPAELDRAVHASAETTFDPLAELTDRFYVVLAEHHAQARLWEQKAPAGEQMTPQKMAKLWDQALEACEKRGENVRDAFGRRLRLSGLPGDLLMLVDPRAVVVEGTRLPEDNEDWAAWVAEERP